MKYEKTGRHIAIVTWLLNCHTLHC